MANPRCPLAGTMPGRVPIANAAFACIARANREISFTRGNGREKLGQNGFVMLQIAINDRQDRRTAGKHPLDNGRGQSAPPDPLYNPHLAVCPADFADMRCRAIRGVIIDENRFPVQASQRH